MQGFHAEALIVFASAFFRWFFLFVASTHPAGHCLHSGHNDTRMHKHNQDDQAQTHNIMDRTELYMIVLIVFMGAVIVISPSGAMASDARQEA